MIRATRNLIVALACALLLALCTTPAHGMIPGLGTGLPDVGTPSTSEAESAPAPAAEPEVEDELSSPRAMVQAYLDEFDLWRKGGTESTRLLAYLPPSYRSAFDDAGVRDALRIGAVLDKVRAEGALRIFRLPDATSDTRFTWRIQPPTQEAAALVLQSDESGAWRFSTEAVDTLTRLHAELFPDEYLLRSFFERMGAEVLLRDGVFGIQYYQWISLFMLVFAAWLIDMVVQLLSLAVVRRYLKREDDGHTPGDSKKLIKRSVKPFGLAAAGGVLYFGIPHIELLAQAEGVLRVAAKTFAMFGVLWAAFRVVDLVGEHFQRRAAKTATRFDDLLVPLLRKSVKTLLAAVGLIFIAESLSLPVTSLVTGFGIAGAAIAFASKDTIENLFGSVAVILDRPFNAGDWVVVGDTEGIVEQLGFRSTRVRTFYNSLVTVPNALLVRATVDNYGQRKFRRFRTMIAVTYDTDPDAIDAFTEGIRELIRKHPDTRKDYFEVHLNGFGDHSLDILLYMFFRVPDWSAELRARHLFMLDVIRLAHRLGVRFAFPTQTLELVRSGEIPEQVAAHQPSREKALEEGTRAAHAVLERR